MYTAPVATAPATGAGAINTSIQFGAACSISGMAGTYQYAGGTATLVCTPFATSTAPTMPSTAISTRSCAEDGFPATWTRTATGSCVAPVVYTAPVATAPSTAATTAPTTGGSISPGMACSTGGYPGSYQYSGASLICVAFTVAPVATAPPATTGPVATAPPATTGPVATAPPATTGPVATAPPAAGAGG